MVRRGEYLERSVVIPGPDDPVTDPSEEGPSAPAVLEGLHHRGRRSPPILVMAGHPAEGASMEVPVVAELAWAFTRAGHPTLRFNYPGVGASGGVFNGASARTSARSADEQLRANTDGLGSPAWVGVGWGGDLALDAAFHSGLDAIAIQPGRPPEPPVRAQSPPGRVMVVFAEADAPDRIEAFRGPIDAVGGRVVVVPDADAAWVRRLHELGRLCVEHFAPPLGEIELSPED